MRQVLALVLATAIPGVPGPSSVATALAGRVVGAEGAPLAQGAVCAGSSCAALSREGTFRIDGLPSGPTELAIKTSDGLYVVEDPVVLAPGTARRVDLALRGRKDTSAPAPAPPKTKSRRGWSNPVTATLVVVGSAVVVGAAVDHLTRREASPF
jgi:hypothetical protein